MVGSPSLRYRFRWEHGSRVAGETAIERCKGAAGAWKPDTEDWDTSLAVVANGELGLVKVGKEIRNVTVA